MKITTSEVRFTHEGKRWTAILRWDNAGGLIENEGREGEWCHLFNANADEVIKLLQEKGIPTENIPVPAKEHSQPKVKKAVFLCETMATVYHYAEGLTLKEKFKRLYYKGDHEKIDAAWTENNLKHFRVSFADSETEYEHVSVTQDAVEFV